MENPVNNLIENVCGYFLEETRREYKRKPTSLIRVHTEKLKNLGDISFPIGPDTWTNYFAGRASVEVNRNLLDKFHDGQAAEESKNSFLATASKWRYPVQELSVQSGRCSLFLNRRAVMELLLTHLLAEGEMNNPFGRIKKKVSRTISCLPLTAEVPTDLSRYRAHLIDNVLRRVVEYSEWNLSETENPAADGALNLRVLSVVDDSKKGQLESEGGVVIQCGLVRDPQSGKLATISSKEYIELRSSDMQLMAMHKYGIRAKDDKRFCALMDRLGAAAVTVDLLEVKHSSPVQIIRNGQGSTKGASFILYNSARLETLLRTFEDRVESASYPQLPDLNSVDLSLLCEEEEWQLLFGYIFQFPNLIERCLEQIEQGSCATHLVVRYLSDFVGVFSVYYRRVRILLEARDHMLPLVYARIYLVKATRLILNKALALLSIEPVNFM